MSLFATITLPLLLDFATSRRVRTTDCEKTSGKNNSWEPFYSQLTITRLWAMSHIFFTFCILSAILIPTAHGKAAFLGLAGLSWAVTSWVPYAVLGILINLSHADLSASSDVVVASPSTTLEPGLVLGLHNVAICLPQIIISFGSGLLWRYRGPADETDTSTIAMVFTFGAIAALIAYWLTRRVETPNKCHPERGFDVYLDAEMLRLDRIR